MQSVSCQSMRAIEDRAFAVHSTAEALMDEAGYKIAQKILHYYPQLQHATAYLGKGHNAGDAIVVLQHLQQAGWTVNLQTPLRLNDFAPLTQKKINALGSEYLQNQQPPAPKSLLIDGLLGIGASGPLRDPITTLAKSINHHRNKLDCTVIALDIPSGVNGDTGEIAKNAVLADHTITIGYPKIGILKSNTVQHVGALSLVTLPELQPQNAELAHHPHLICEHTLTRKRRDFDTHKGQTGRVAIWAGSMGMLGAAELSATAALRAGAGLVTVFIEPSLYPILASMLPPEIMLRPCTSPLKILEERFDAIAIGPGIGSPSEDISNQLIEVVRQTSVPTVLDADMLNLIANQQALPELTHHCILTPHPGEMRRLLPNATRLSREETVKQFLELVPVTLLYKGARTLIAQTNSPLFINSTGSPAMATAGQGDVLTGLIAGLCAQKYDQLEASKIAVWLAGEAAQIALASGSETIETLTAGSILQHLHFAFSQLPRTT
ncbi:NAD(P)H-hydrate dehydratase [Rubritalea spongiae]|uniref:ADP-dependent (S)-NAD(P)H-hydrate dehydratase n=1 Tax=Rubritalea spongiae TaxID=430797 RepID=A0ABW5E0H0_9BACT